MAKLISIAKLYKIKGKMPDGSQMDLTTFLLTVPEYLLYLDGVPTETADLHSLSDDFVTDENEYISIKDLIEEMAE